MTPRTVVATGRLTRRPEASRRLCVACRAARPAAALVQLKGADADGETKTRHGRGAYVCISHACLAAVHTKLLARALRVNVAAVPSEALCATLATLAEAKLLAALGLARRSGELINGVDRLQEACASLDPPGEDWVALVAPELSERSRRRVPEAPEFVSALRMGQAVGVPEAMAVGVGPGRLGLQAAYWLRVWYESRGMGRGATSTRDGLRWRDE